MVAAIIVKTVTIRRCTKPRDKFDKTLSCWRQNQCFHQLREGKPKRFRMVSYFFISKTRYLNFTNTIRNNRNRRQKTEFFLNNKVPFSILRYINFYSKYSIYNTIF